MIKNWTYTDNALTALSFAPFPSADYWISTDDSMCIYTSMFGKCVYLPIVISLPSMNSIYWLKILTGTLSDQ